VLNKNGGAPGPGQYDESGINKLKYMSPSFTIGNKRDARKGADNPGPGNYQPNSDFNKNKS
jgi:hypothetical protein